MEGCNVADVVVFNCKGWITAGEGATTFHNTIRGLLDNGSKRLVLDVSNVTSVDSTGVQTLVSTCSFFVNNGGELKLVGLDQHVQKLLHMTAQYGVLEPHLSPDVASAIQAFN